MIGVVITSARQSGDGVGDPGRLVSLATERHRREVRRVGLHQQPVARYQAQQILIIPFLERDDSAERHVPARIERKLGKGYGACVAMQDADYVRRSCFADETTGVLLSVTRVYDEWLAHLVRDLYLGGESRALRIAWGIVVVVVETALAHCDCRVSKRLA